MVTRTDALALLKNTIRQESLIHHALSVEATMRAFAQKAGEDPDYWGLVGLLHDVDWQMFPEQHCKKAPELLGEIGCDDAFIHAVCSHGWGICSDVEPKLYMEKVLYTIDELTGLINATALMRPTHMEGMTVKSVKKKWSSKGFAAGVNRDVIAKGAEMLGMDISELISVTVGAMQGIAKDIGL